MRTNFRFRIEEQYKLFVPARVKVLNETGEMFLLWEGRSVEEPPLISEAYEAFLALGTDPSIKKIISFVRTWGILGLCIDCGHPESHERGGSWGGRNQGHCQKSSDMVYLKPQEYEENPDLVPYWKWEHTANWRKTLRRFHALRNISANLRKGELGSSKDWIQVERSRLSRLGLYERLLVRSQCRDDELEALKLQLRKTFSNQWSVLEQPKDRIRSIQMARDRMAEALKDATLIQNEDEFVEKWFIDQGKGLMPDSAIEYIKDSTLDGDFVHDIKRYFYRLCLERERLDFADRISELAGPSYANLSFGMTWSPSMGQPSLDPILKRFYTNVENLTGLFSVITLGLLDEVNAGLYRCDTCGKPFTLKDDRRQGRPDRNTYCSPVCRIDGHNARKNEYYRRNPDVISERRRLSRELKKKAQMENSPTEEQAEAN